MKRKISQIIIIMIVVLNCFSPLIVYGEESLSYDEKIKEEFDKLEAPNILLGNTNTGEILYQKDVDEKVYPASLTKMMTALLVVENCELDEIVTVSENAVKSVPTGYVNANLQVGEQLTVEDLLYVMLIPSANDAANALAEYVGGSIESFSTMMNTRAKEIGCLNSNFINPSGLHEVEHVSTARDLFLISNEAIKNDTIKKIVQTTNFTIPQTEQYSGEPRIFTTTNYLKLKNMSNFYMYDCIGGKTGYTGAAKNCVIEFASKNNINLTAVILGEKSVVKGQKFLDCKKMFEYIFENYSMKKLAQKDDVYKTIEVDNADADNNKLKVLYKNDLDILVENKDSRIKEEIELIKEKAPIIKSEKVGNVKYTYKGKDYNVEIIAADTIVEENTMIIIGICIIIIFIIYCFKKSNKKIGKHGKTLKKRK